MNNRIAIVASIDTTFKVLLMAQVKAAQKAGYNVYGICSQGPNFDYLQAQGIRMHAIEIKRKMSPLSDCKALWQLYLFFKNEKIDIVHAHMPKVVHLVPIAAKLAGVPVIICTLRGFTVRDGLKPLPRMIYRFIAWISAKCSTFLLSQNPEDVQRYIDAGVCRKEQIAALGNGVDLKKFDPDRFDEEFSRQKRNEINIPENAVIIGIIGRLVREKGYCELFEAMREILKIRDDVWLVIIGPDEPEKADRISADIVREYGIESRCRYLGSRDDIPELLSCFDIYCLPSWREGFPRSAIEAAAMGLPVVATNIPGCRQVVEDGKNGLLVELRNSEELKASLLKLIASPSLREKMGKAGYEKARTEFDEQRVCQIVLDTYEETLNKSQ